MLTRCACAADPSPLLQQWYDFATQPGRADPAAGLKVRLMRNAAACSLFARRIA